MPDQGGQRHVHQLGGTARHDADLQEHVWQLLRGPHHQAERLQPPPELFPPVQHSRGHGRTEVTTTSDLKYL